MFTVADWTDPSSVGFGLSCLPSQNGLIKFGLVWSIMFTVAEWTGQVLFSLVYHLTVAEWTDHVLFSLFYHVYRRRMD